MIAVEGRRGVDLKWKRNEHGITDSRHFHGIHRETSPGFLCVCVFLGLYPQHMEVPRPGLQSELLLPAYATATAMPDLSCVLDLHHGSRQCWILNPLSYTVRFCTAKETINKMKTQPLEREKMF